MERSTRIQEYLGFKSQLKVNLSVLFSLINVQIKSEIKSDMITGELLRQQAVCYLPLASPGKLEGVVDKSELLFC